MTETLPLVSAMMPTYNVAPFLEHSLRSVLNQVYGNFEIVIVDDGSTDSTREILERYAARDARIKLMFAPHEGRGSARNKCLANSQGEFIAVCDADDVSFINRFKQQVDFMTTNPDIDVVTAGYIYFAGASPAEWSQQVAVETDPARIARSLDRGRMRVPNGVAMIRRSGFKKAGGYNPALLRAQDFEFFLRLHRAGGRFAALEQPLAFFRQQRRIPELAYFVENGLYTSYARLIHRGFPRGFADFRAGLPGRTAAAYYRFKYAYFWLKYTALYRKGEVATKFLPAWSESVS